MEEIDYNTTPELSNLSPKELSSLSKPQKYLLYRLLCNMKNNILKNTFLIKTNEYSYTGLTPVLLLLIKYCNEWKNIVVVCKSIYQSNSLFDDCQKILKGRFVKIEDNKIYFLDNFDTKSDDILHCITFCQKPDFTYKALLIWTEDMYTEMKYYHPIFTFPKSIWILNSKEIIREDLFEESDIIALK